MKKLMAIALCSFLGLATTATVVGALEATFGVAGSKAIYGGTGKQENQNETNTSTVTETKRGMMTDDYQSAFLEVGNEMVSLGVEFSPVLGNTPENTANEQLSSPNKVQVDLEEAWSVYAKVNIPLGGAYVRAGYMQVDVLTQETMNSGNTYPDAESEGILIAIGYEHEMGEGFKLRAEIAGSEFDDIKVNNGAATNTNTITVYDLRMVHGRIGIAKTF